MVLDFKVNARLVVGTTINFFIYLYEIVIHSLYLSITLNIRLKQMEQNNYHYIQIIEQKYIKYTTPANVGLTKLAGDHFHVMFVQLIEG